MGYQSRSALKIEPQAGGNKFNISGKMDPWKEHQGCFFNGTVDVLSPEKIVYSFTATPNQPISKPYFSLRFNKNMLDRPLTLRIRPDGKQLYFKKVTVAADRKGGWIWSSPSGQDVDEISLPMLHGTLKLSGFKCPVMICKYGKNTGNIRIYLSLDKVKKYFRTKIR